MRTLSASLAAALLTGLAADVLAADEPGVVPFEVQVGEAAVIARGPIRNLICDDPALVEIVDQGDAIALRGRKVGQTLCSYWDPLVVRKVLRVNVTEAPVRGPGPTRGSGR